MTTAKKIPSKISVAIPRGKVYFSPQLAPWDIAFPHAGGDSFKLWVLQVCPKALRLSAPQGW